MPEQNSSIPWAEQAETMTKAWTEAQQNLWKSWLDMIQSAPNAAPFYPGVTGQWQTIAKQSMEAWMANAQPAVKDTAQQMMGSQEVFVRFLEFASEAWNAIASRVESGQSWQEDLLAYTNQIQQYLVQSPQDFMKANEDLDKLWQMYLQQWSQLSGPWMQSWQQAPGTFGQAVTGNESAIVDMANLYWKAYDQSFGKLLQGPRVGLTRELNQKIAQGFQSWLEARRAEFEYQVVMSNASIKAFEQFGRSLIERGEKGEPVSNLRQMVTVWNNSADSVFVDLFQTDEFVKLQGKLLKTSMTYRIHEREITDTFLEMNNVPTRTELDQAYKTMYEQRKEIKALRKAVTELQTAIGHNSTAKKTSRRKKADTPAPEAEPAPVAEAHQEGGEH